MKLHLNQATISFLGGNAGNFITAMKDEMIDFSKISYKNGILTGNISAKDLPFTRALAEKNGVELRIEYQRGLLFTASPYKKRVGMFVGGITSILLLIFLQFFAWDIVFPKSHALSEDLVLLVLEECGLHKGSFLPAVDIEQVRLNAMSKLPQVSWFALNRKGSRIEVEFTEALLKPFVREDAPCNIVAAKTATILETRIFSGQQIAQKGDTVKEGELLVSGIIEGRDGRFYKSHSSADITALTYFEKEFSIALNNTVKQATGKTVFQKYCILFGKRVPLFLRKAHTENALLKTHSEPLRIFGIPLPIQIETEIISYYDEVMTAFSEEEALKLLEQAASQYEAEVLKDAKIVSRNLAAGQSENIFTLHIDYRCIEEIGVLVPIETESEMIE